MPRKLPRRPRRYGNVLEFNVLDVSAKVEQVIVAAAANLVDSVEAVMFHSQLFLQFGEAFETFQGAVEFSSNVLLRPKPISGLNGRIGRGEGFEQLRPRRRLRSRIPFAGGRQTIQRYARERERENLPELERTYILEKSLIRI